MELSDHTEDTAYHLDNGVSIHAATDEAFQLAKKEAFLPRTKQGQLFCGECCDMRRAVIIVNLVNMLFLMTSFFGLVSKANEGESAAQFDDDNLKHALSEYGQVNMSVVFFLMVVQVVMSSIGLVGAFVFNKWLVGVAALTFTTFGVLSLIHFDVGAFLYIILVAYPHFVLVYEIREGIMTKETYYYEEHSCCCV